MQAVTIVDGELVVAERADPTPRGRQVLVRVTASGVNRADLLQRAGGYAPPPGVPADVPGLEFGGRVEALGPDATGWSAGDRVMGLVGGGAHAELLVVEDDQLVAVPDTLDDVVAGSSPEVFATAHDALVTRAGLRPGERVLIHAVASGVGTAAVQLVRALGAVPVGTTRSPEKLDAVRALGLEAGCVVADPTGRAASDAVAALGAPDVVLDLVGGPYVALDARVAAPRARIVVVGLLAGGRCEFPLTALLGKRLDLHGTVLRSRPPHEKVEVTRAFAREVLPWLADGTLAPVLDSTFPLARARDAYDLVGSNTTTGKVTLTV